MDVCVEHAACAVVPENSPFLAMPGLPAPFHVVFTTRLAGVSSKAYASLNLALHVGDDPRRVRENRELVCKAWGLSSEKLVVAAQVHGVEVAEVDGRDAGRGSFSHGDAIPGADALLTRAKNLPLLGLSADCLLVALGDPQAGVLAVAHAGWRGMAGGILEKTVAALIASGAKAENVHACGAASIGPRCFEVGREVAEALGQEHVVRENGDKVWIDLRRAAFARLQKSGVPETQIQISEECTCCREDLFFSYRRGTQRGERACGRMGMLAWAEL